MKTSLFILSVLAAGTLTALAQNTNETVTAHITPALSQSHLEFKTQPMNEMARGRYVYTGVIVEALNSKQPAQLFNPLAPPEYGTGDYNLHRDIITGQPHGFKFFSIKF